MNTTKAVKKWEVLPGKNRFFCDGRIVTGSQQSVFILTLFLVFGVTTLFFVFDSPYLAQKLSLGIPIVAAVLFLFLLLFLFQTSWTDPGILPRALPDEAAYTDRLIERMVMNNDPPRMSEVVINGVPTKLKYCSTCKIFRPPRASHCSVCDNCVERFDHHCPWVGNCIGKRNYRYFYCFLVSVTIFCCYVLAFSVTTLVLRSLESDFVTAMKNSPGSIIEVVITFIALWSVVGLTGFHTFLASCNITTNEDIKNMYSKAGQKNPFSHDSLIKNYCEIFCGPLSPSLIDRRGLVREECAAVSARPSHPGDAPAGNVTTVASSPKKQHINPSLPQHNFSSSATASQNHSSSLAAAQPSTEIPLASETPPTTAVAVVALGRYGNSYNSAVLYPTVASRTDLTSVTISI